LHARVQAARAASTSTRPHAAKVALSAFQQEVSALASKGELTPADAARLLVAARQAQARVPVDVRSPVESPGPSPSSQTSTAVTPLSPPATPGGGETPGRGHGKALGLGHGKDHGKGGDEGGD